MAFLTETDGVISRMGAELVFLNQLVDAQRKQLEEEKKNSFAVWTELTNNLTTTVEASEAKDRYIKELELQIDKMKETSNVTNAGRVVPRSGDIDFEGREKINGIS